jgi:TonB family protein
VGTYAIWFRKGCTDNVVRHCHIFDFGAGGVRIGEMGLPAKEAEATERSKGETVVEKSARKAASSEQRAAKRAAMKAKMGNVGVFAELTAAGSGGGGGAAKGGVRDLIGSIDASSSLSGMSISGASFASKRAEAFEVGSGGGTGTGVGGRRGERTEGGTISTSGLSSASAGTLKSQGNIEVSNVENVQGEAANEASRDMKTLQQVLQRYQPRLKKVYEDFLKRYPDLAGKMVVKFTIEADGSVSDVTVMSSDLKDKELERNLVRYIERIKFPSASGKVTIEWPLIFSAT